MTRREEVNLHALIIALPTGEWCKVYGAIPRKDKPTLRISVRVK
jgi:hypothetical protein